ncbi:hypothetical protein FACS1894132_03090 [Clostridia bacterium]|nr:hypothetical protein FACS1894132_03090 [Clostridia bacterium]
MAELTINFNEIDKYLSFLKGKTVNIIIDENNKVIIEEKKNIRPPFEFGTLKGKIWMADDFDAPLDEFKEYM